MSIKVSSWVWEHSEQSGSALLLLLAIADHAHDDGGGAYPSIATLAKKARTSERNVKYLLKTLQVSGELEVIKNAGPNRTNIYRVKILHPQEVEGETQRQEGVKSVSPKPSLEPSIYIEKVQEQFGEIADDTYYCISRLAEFEKYPKDVKANIEHIEKLKAKHPDVYLPKHVEDFCDYYEEQGFKAREKPRGKLTQWMIRHRDWSKPRNGSVRPEQKPRVKEYVN